MYLQFCMQNQRTTWLSCSKPKYTRTSARSYSVQATFDLSVSPLITKKNSLSFVGEEVCHQMHTIGWLASLTLSFATEAVCIASHLIPIKIA